jgi:hypothetical protein
VAASASSQRAPSFDPVTVEQLPAEPMQYGGSTMAPFVVGEHGELIGEVSGDQLIVTSERLDNRRLSSAVQQQPASTSPAAQPSVRSHDPPGVVRRDHLPPCRAAAARRIEAEVVLDLAHSSADAQATQAEWWVRG